MRIDFETEREMKRVKNFSAIMASTGVMLFFILMGCTTYRVKEPKIGITKKLLSPAKEGLSYLSGLDSSKGLFVFSYEVRGVVGKGTYSDKYETKSGFRVWEHKFKSSEPDTLRKREVMNLWSSKTAFPGGERTADAYRVVDAFFQRGRIFYGGQFQFLAESNKHFAQWILLPSDSLYEAFLTGHKRELEGIVIDTLTK